MKCKNLFQLYEFECCFLCNNSCYCFFFFCSIILCILYNLESFVIESKSIECQTHFYQVIDIPCGRSITVLCDAFIVILIGLFTYFSFRMN